MIANLVGGRWTPAQTDEALGALNPATGEEIDRVPMSSGADVDVAIDRLQAVDGDLVGHPGGRPSFDSGFSTRLAANANRACSVRGVQAPGGQQSFRSRTSEGAQLSCGARLRLREPCVGLV